MTEVPIPQPSQWQPSNLRHLDVVKRPGNSRVIVDCFVKQSFSFNEGYLLCAAAFFAT